MANQYKHDSNHVCAWCECVINSDHSRGRKLGRLEYTSRDNHGICKQCRDEIRNELPGHDMPEGN